MFSIKCHNCGKFNTIGPSVTSVLVGMLDVKRQDGRSWGTPEVFIMSRNRRDGANGERLCRTILTQKFNCGACKKTLHIGLAPYVLSKAEALLEDPAIEGAMSRLVPVWNGAVRRMFVCTCHRYVKPGEYWDILDQAAEGLPPGRWEIGAPSAVGVKTWAAARGHKVKYLRTGSGHGPKNRAVLDDFDPELLVVLGKPVPDESSKWVPSLREESRAAAGLMSLAKARGLKTIYVGTPLLQLTVAK